MAKKLIKSLIIVLALIIGKFLIVDAHAELKISINQGKMDPMPIVVTDFAGSDGELASLGRQITEVIANDLSGSGLFKPVNNTLFETTMDPADLKPRLIDWKQVKAETLVAGYVSYGEGGKIKINFKLWDTFSEQLMAGFSYTTESENWRRIAHMIADAIYKRITGDEGYFDSQIAYISETGPERKRIKRLAIMDYDGENHRYLTSGNNLVLTPRISPSRPEIAYMAFINGKPKVTVMNLETMQNFSIDRLPGMTFAPRFSPDGNKLSFSHADRGKTVLNSYDLQTKQTQQITSPMLIDTSPSYSPDGNKIVFNSDRGGSAQLYIMNADGSGVERISFGEGRYTTPVWSPRGDWIAFTKLKKGNFFIGVMKPDGSGERLIASGYMVEGPAWSPNGRLIVFSKQSVPGGMFSIAAIDLTGYNERRIKTPHGASDPSWSIKK